MAAAVYENRGNSCFVLVLLRGFVHRPAHPSLSGVSSRDFSEVVGIDVSPHLITPADDIVALCRQRSEDCARQADELSAALPPPNPYGRPPLPWHRTLARRASELYRASQAWNAMARALLSNRWTG